MSDIEIFFLFFIFHNTIIYVKYTDNDRLNDDDPIFERFSIMSASYICLFACLFDSISFIENSYNSGFSSVIGIPVSFWTWICE
jgi:hypothetical protein